MTGLQLIAKLQAIDVSALVSDSIEETKDEYIAGIKRQLLDGFDGNGERLNPSYRNRKYAEYKNTRNPVPGIGNPDLFLTGAWFAGMDLIVEGENVHTGSTDEKDLDLQQKYGPDIMRLGGNYNDDYVQQDLSPVVKKNFTDLTNLKFT